MADDQKLEVLEEEIKVLKGEVRRTLVDLRALVMRADSPLNESGVGRRGAMADLAPEVEAPATRRESAETVRQEIAEPVITIPPQPGAQPVAAAAQPPARPSTGYATGYATGNATRGTADVAYGTDVSAAAAAASSSDAGARTAARIPRFGSGGADDENGRPGSKAGGAGQEAR